jgi:hypothetical protein
MTSIRTYTATPADIGEILELGQQMHAESAFRHFDFDIPKCAMLFHTCLTNPDTHFIRVAVSPTNEIVGLLIGFISEHYFGRDLIASDYLWYVTPEHRGSKAALALLRDFQKWAEDRNAAEVHMGISTGVHAEKTGALLERLGYDLVGGNYKLRVVV